MLVDIRLAYMIFNIFIMMMGAYFDATCCEEGYCWLQLLLLAAYAHFCEKHFGRCAISIRLGNEVTASVKCFTHAFFMLR